MDEYIQISMLNDFIFCPYSIYLHNIYNSCEEQIVHAEPQTKGKAVHIALDERKYSTRKDDVCSLTVFSDELGLIGKIDLYKGSDKYLVDRKHYISTIYLGQKYQLWAYYFAMIEMGFEIEKIAFYSISNNTTLPIPIPNDNDKTELISFINKFKNFNPEDKIETNENKCKHCIYNNLCDFTEVQNVYSQ